jgi:hypothetical protein
MKRSAKEVASIARSRKEIAAVLETGITEVNKLLATQPRAWVVCSADDSCPFRTNGKEIRLFGGPIWTSLDRDDANRVAMTLHRKARESESKMDVVSLPVTIWAPNRVKVIRALIAQLNATPKE